MSPRDFISEIANDVLTVKHAYRPGLQICSRKSMDCIKAPALGEPCQGQVSVKQHIAR